MPGFGGVTLFITSTPAFFSRENTTVAVPPAGMSPDTVRTSGAAKICSAVDGVGAGRSAMPDAERAEPDHQRGRCGQHRRLPALDARPQLRAPALAARLLGEQPVAQVSRRLDGGGRRHHGHGLPHRADFVVERLRDVGRGGGDASFDVGEFGLGHRVQRVRRREGDQVGICRLGHATPRHLRRPRMASRIRDLIVARFADSRSDTWT